MDKYREQPEALARGNFFTDFSHLDLNKKYQVSELLKFLRTKANASDLLETVAQLAEHFGLGVTQITDAMNEFSDLKPKAELSISQSAEALTKSQNALNVANGIDAKATNALNLSESADTLSKSVQSQFNQVVIDGDSSVEAAQARVDASGHANATLKERLDKEHNEVTTQLAQKANYYWIPDVQPAARVDESPHFINGFNGDAVYYEENLFEPFLTSHPEYVKREFVSKDASGQYDINRYVFAPKNYKKTIIIQTCLHGGEVTPMLVMARFLHYLVNHWESNRELGNIRNNVRIVYTPIANPWGVSQTPRTRQNSNGVDLNRNFDYKWAQYPTGEPFIQNYKGISPNSEVETKAVIDTIKAYHDATSFLDFHNTGSPMRDIYIDLPENYKYNVYDNIIDYFLRDVEDPDVLLDKNNFPKVGNYMYENYQHIAASTPEWCDTRFGGTTYSSTEITQALEWFGNVIIEHVREFTGKERVRMVNNLELTNEATNGDLSDELTGWLRAGIENETVENGMLTATANGVNFPPSTYYWLNKGQIKGDRIFASADIIAPVKCNRIELRVRNNDNPSWDGGYVINQVDNLNPGQKVRISGDYIFSQDITSVALMVAFIMESNTPDIKGEPIAVGKLFYIPLSKELNMLPIENIDYIIENNEWFTTYTRNNHIINANFLEPYERDMWYNLSN